MRVVGRLVLNRVVDNFFAETEQVAFCTQNIVRGVDFTDDPLLQGRNFSYLDTQLKRLGSPNFTHLPINAPKCPFAHFQQDGHMAMTNPKGRANYEPNSWGTDKGGPREDPGRGFFSYEERVEGAKRRVRSETFADHYSQARQFYISQTEEEQSHIADAFTFELSKVETEAIRARVVSHLRNVDDKLAKKVAENLGLDLPAAAKPARKPITTLKPSDPLSIMKNPPANFAGRKLGVLVSDGAPAAVVKALKSAMKAEGAMFKVVAPKIGGVTLDNGEHLPADEKIDGGPSVLFDAVALVVSEEGCEMLAKKPETRDFVADAFAHKKFIGYVEAAQKLFHKAGVDTLDEGCVALSRNAAKGFIETLRSLRYWDRKP